DFRRPDFLDDALPRPGFVAGFLANASRGAQDVGPAPEAAGHRRPRGGRLQNVRRAVDLDVLDDRHRLGQDLGSQLELAAQTMDEPADLAVVSTIEHGCELCRLRFAFDRESLRTA